MKKNTDKTIEAVGNDSDNRSSYMKGQEEKEAPLRVLVVEDNEDDEALLMRQLTKSGMAAHVKFIRNGEEAWQFLLAHQKELSATIMVIFLDLKLPGLSGLELLRHLRHHSSLRKIPVVVMTSSNDPADLDECNALKVDNYIEKPVSFSSFAKAMADVFHIQSSHHAEPQMEVLPTEYS